MVFFRQNAKMSELQAQLVALHKSQAVIEFDMDGTIMTANANFLNTFGYQLNEIQGRHHSLFVEPSYRDSQEYRSFWANLNRGEFQSAQYKRLGKGGREVWIEASYNPILDKTGKPYKVVKFATEITQQKIEYANFIGQINAIGKSQAVIEFRMDGTIIAANANFLALMGYSLAEVIDKHHRMFVEPHYADSSEYRQFWAGLNSGRFDSGEYKRIAKGGREVWIQASYNPILDLNGTPFKVVKYATDITEEKFKNADFTGQINAIRRSQAVIEFNPDGTIITANPIFLQAMGYGLEEIVGKHHRLFVDQSTANSQEYEGFWTRLRSGHYSRSVFKRIRKNGSEIWLQASYNPILDADGKVYKVVKFASDITDLMQVSMITDEASGKVQSVASAVEEMSASINEISHSMSLTSDAAKGINDVTTQADLAAEKMDARTQQMEDIVKIIESIAGQTNLLALNATIEAARAGEAGKGFSVVANEVKSLAGQTKKATENVAMEIQKVQEASKSLKNNIGEISRAADTVNRYVSSVAGAVEEQTAVTREIASNTSQTATLVAEIAERIQGLSKQT